MSVLHAALEHTHLLRGSLSQARHTTSSYGTQELYLHIVLMKRLTQHGMVTTELKTVGVGIRMRRWIAEGRVQLWHRVPYRACGTSASASASAPVEHVLVPELRVERWTWHHWGREALVLVCAEGQDGRGVVSAYGK